ncbi:hypothetical protein ACJ73_05067 [Blastomyces percursus]|uniref:Uncharacterized protein n=1 Tax=Blastomyces percursus TaxID=1658174 RepID=A0A1J9QTM7_9EURO|nr:hypothetical protein ACJ73_05067 [Blastomyces percursus]
MALSIKHQLQRWTVQQLHRIGFTNVTLSTPLPTRGDGSTFDMDEDYDARSAQLREQHGHPRTHSHADIYEGSRTYSLAREKCVPISAYSWFERVGLLASGIYSGPGILEGWVVLVRIGLGKTSRLGEGSKR